MLLAKFTFEPHLVPQWTSKLSDLLPFALLPPAVVASPEEWKARGNLPHQSWSSLLHGRWVVVHTLQQLQRNHIPQYYWQLNYPVWHSMSILAVNRNLFQCQTTLFRRIFFLTFATALYFLTPRKFMPFLPVASLPVPGDCFHVCLSLL